MPAHARTARNGVVVRKFMLNISNEMQARRLLQRLKRPEKVHKFSASDLPERGYWDLCATMKCRATAPAPCWLLDLSSDCCRVAEMRVARVGTSRHTREPSPPPLVRTRPGT
jgi:polyphosphate kinase 2 (PPK2 family)